MAEMYNEQDASNLIEYYKPLICGRSFFDHDREYLLTNVCKEPSSDGAESFRVVAAYTDRRTGSVRAKRDLHTIAASLKLEPPVEVLKWQDHL